MENYRLFLSSPADVQTERDRVEAIVKKINAERIDHPQLALVRWELEYYRADATFQAQIPKPSDCQLVVCIFWKRLGTDLPAVYVRTDGTTPTGTEYEFEEALTAAAARPEKLPDVLVYRKTADVSFSLETLEFEKAQYDRFMSFWQRWFRNEKGQFLAGFQSFSDADDFDVVFERNLRAWLSDRETDVSWTQGSPYRGLEPFDVEHAAIFFGRRREVERARARLISSAMGGKPFLLIAGASGSGKSSLVRAGLIPRLNQLGGLSTLASALRRTAVTPGQIAEDWPGGLAAALFEPHALGEELRLGDFDDARKLATQIARADSSAAAPLVRALQRAGERLAAVEGRSTPVKVVMLILIDQLEELFAWPHDKAEGFLALIQELCKAPESPVWVVATMRSDFQHRLAEFPALEALAGRAELKGPYEAERTLDLGLPSAGDLRDMILNPARAAGLEFEMSADGARDLAQLIEADARPEAMPAVQFLLSELYARRKGNLLTLEAFDALGGVDGVMAQRGEDVYRTVEPAARDAFPRMVRALVTQVRGDVPASTRRVSEQAFAADPPAMRLIGALREARLIISDRGELRFTHDSILTGWSRLKDQIAEEQRLFGARERLEQYCRRWVEASEGPGSARGKLLLDGFPLAEGCELLAKWGASGLSDRQPELPDYIKASDARQKRARRIVQAIGWSIAAVFAGFSILLYGQWQSTLKAQKETEVSLLIAKSQSYLRDRQADLALENADRAFRSLPSEASRSALLSALIEISPHLMSVIPLASDTSEALAWTGDDTLAYATGSGQLRSFDAGRRQSGADASGSALPNIKRPQDGNRSVARTLWPLGADRLLAIFDEGSVGLLQRGAGAPKLRAPTQEISVNPTAHAVAVGRSGSLIAMATADGAIILYRCDWRDMTQALPACQAAPLAGVQGRAVAISPDEMRIAVGDQGGAVTVYDVSGNPIGSPAAVDAPVIALGWAPDRDWLAVGTTRGEVVVLDIGTETKTVVARDTFGDRPASTLAWSPKQSDLAFVCNGSSVCLWRFNEGAGTHDPFKPTMRFEGHLNAVTRLSWAPTGARVASGAADGTIRLWSIDQIMDAGFALYSDEAAEISAVAASSDGASVAGGTGDGAIRLWNANTGAPGRVITSASGSEVVSLSWNRKGGLAAIHDNSSITVVAADTQQPPIEFDIKAGDGSRLAWTDEDRTIAVPLRDGRVALFDTRQLSDVQPAYLEADNVKDEAWGIAVRPSDRMLFASYTNGDIRLWDLASGKYLATLANPTTKPLDKVGAGSLSISPDGRLLATSGGDRFVSVYDIGKRALWRELATDANETRAVAFSPDGRRLAALGADDRLYVWELAQDTATRHVVVAAVPGRATVGDIVKRAEHASWLAWMSNDRIAVATGSAAVTVVELDATKWRKRIDGLASPAGASVK